MNESAAPMPVTLAGKEYLIKPLDEGTINDTITLWVRSRFLSAVRESMQGQPQPVKDSEMEIAHRVSMDINWNSELGRKQLAAPSGQAKLLYESIKPTCPSVTMAKCYGLLKSSEDEEAFLNVFREVNDITSEAVETEKKNAPREK